MLGNGLVPCAQYCYKCFLQKRDLVVNSTGVRRMFTNATDFLEGLQMRFTIPLCSLLQLSFGASAYIKELDLASPLCIQQPSSCLP